MKKRIILCLLVLTIIVTNNGYLLLSAAESPNAFLPYSTPEKQEMNSKKLDDMLDLIEETQTNIKSIIIIRNDHIVFEEYIDPEYNCETLHEICSITKSFTSALIGIAIENGFIEGLDQKIFDFFPDKTVLNDCEWKRNLTIKHFLTMTAGFNWSEIGADHYDWNLLMTKIDPVGYLLNKPMIHEPGTVFCYNTGLSHTLMHIIQKATNMSALNFARQYLLNPLGINHLLWYEDMAGVVFGGSGLYLRHMDMIKLGYLYLNNGSWFGEQIVSAEWINTTTTIYSEGYPGYFEGFEYAYHWWASSEYGVYYASGAYFQALYVVPEYNTVIGFHSWISSGTIFPENLAIEYILEAILSYSPSSNLKYLGFLALIIPIFVVRKKRKIVS